MTLARNHPPQPDPPRNNLASTVAIPHAEVAQGKASNPPNRPRYLLRAAKLGCLVISTQSHCGGKVLYCFPLLPSRRMQVLERS
jgi:hypothetical protein